MHVQRQSNGQLITLSTELGSGGEGKIYTVLQDPTLVAKVYHQNKLTIAHGDKLKLMFANPPNDPVYQGGISIAWPVDLLRSNQQIIGFLMQRATEVHPIYDFYNPGTRRQKSPYFHYVYLHRTARNLAAAVKRLHAGGYVIGDINESNILVSELALVTLVDTDSFQVRDPQLGVVYRCAVGKPEFTPPELQGQSFRDVDRTPEQDLFGLAVLIFQLLMEGTHPFEGVFQGSGDPPAIKTRILSGHFPYSSKGVPYRPKPLAPTFDILHPTLRQLFLRCFEDGYKDSKARPDARTWAIALEEAEKSLVTCSVNNQHRYGGHLRVCPWCERTTRLGGRDPFPLKMTVKQEEHLQVIVTQQLGNSHQQLIQATVTTHLPTSTKSSNSRALGWKRLNAFILGFIGVVAWGLFGLFSNMNPYTHVQRGDERYQVNDYQGAIENYTKAIRLDQSFPNFYLMRGNARYHLEDYQQAAADYTQAIRIYPDFATAHYNRGNTQLALGNVQEAVIDYTKAININPDLAQAYNNRGIARGLTNDRLGALDDFTQTLNIYPSKEVYWERSSVRSDLGDQKGAKDDRYSGSLLSTDKFPYESSCFSFKWCGCKDEKLTEIISRGYVNYCPRKILQTKV